MSIRIRLGLLLSVALLIIMSLAIYASNAQNNLHLDLNKIKSTSSNLIHLTEQLDNNFQKQLLAWTNLLLRGQNSTEYHRYLSAFYQQERNTRNEIKSLLKELNQYKTAKQSTVKFETAHNYLGTRFRKALVIFNDSDTPAYTADKFIWDSVNIPIQLLSQIKTNIIIQHDSLLANIEEEFQDKQLLLLSISFLFLIAVVIFFTWLLDIYLGQPLSKTTAVAKNITQGDYSQRVIENLPGEFNIFAKAFNNMMEKISSTNTQLLENMDSLKVEIVMREALEEELKQEKIVAEEASKTKSEFLSTMSHELRTPLNVVTGYIDLLNFTELSDEQKDYIKSIQSGSSSLLSIINDVLDFAKIESGKLNIEHNSLAISDLLDEIKNMFELPAADKNLQFNINCSSNVPHTITSDFSRLKQILVNLLSNAIKFTEQGHITLSVDVNPNQDPSKMDLVFQVEDSGIGIDDAFLDKLFTQFEQQDGQDSRKYGGSGLGLAISQKLSHLLHGDLAVNSILNKGSVFTLYLFDVEKSDAAIETKDNKIQGFTSLNSSTILIADDLKQNRNLIKDTLRTQPITIIEAVNGREAIKLAKEHLPDLILMDIKMPEMDGIEATKIIKSDERLKTIPILAISASSLQEDNAELKQSLFDDYLTKPVRLKLLIEKLSHYLNT